MNTNPLPVISGNVTIAVDALPGSALETVLTLGNDGSPLVVATGNEVVTDTQITFSGTTSFLNVDKLPVSAVFTQNQDGVLTGATLRFDLSGVDDWTFLTSFPDLPGFKVAGGGRTSQNPLSLFTWSGAAFVLTTEPDTTDPASGVSLQPGLNFVGQAEVGGALGVLEQFLDGGDAPWFGGLIVFPSAKETLPALAFGQFVWAPPAGPAPGITLCTDLGLECALTDSLSLKQTYLWIYSPPSADFITANPTYSAELAIAGTLATTGIESIEIAIIGFENGGGAQIVGAFTGFSLGKLEDLAGLAGASGFSSILPADIQSALDDLSLEAVALALGPKAEVSSVSIVVGIPNATTTVLPDFSISGISATFSVDASADLTVSLQGAASIFDTTVDADLEYPDVRATFTLPDGCTIPIGTILDDIGISAPTLPSFTVDSMTVNVDGKGDYELAATMADGTPWTIDLGPTSLGIENISANLIKQSSGPSGTFGGTIQLGTEVTIALVATANDQGFNFSASVPEISFTDLAAAMTSDTLPVPSGFNFQLLDSAVMLQDASSQITFQFATTVNSFGTLAFQAQDSGGWGIIAGLNIDDVSALGDLPGLSLLSNFTGFTLTELVLVLSTQTETTFSFPGLSAFNDNGLMPSIPGSNVSPPNSGIVNGLNIYATWSLDSGDQKQGLLAKLLKLDGSLAITLQISDPPTDDTRLFISLPAPGQPAITIDGQPLQCEIGVQIQDDQPELFLSGTFSVDIQGTTQTFYVELEFATEGALIMGSMTGTGTLDFGGIEIGDLLVMVGVDWEGVPSFGIAATLEADGIDASIVLLFNSDDPSQSMIAGAISEVSLWQLLDAFTDGEAPDDLEGPLKKVALVGTENQTISADLAADLNGYNLAPVLAAMNTAGFKVSTNAADLLLVLNKDPSDQPADEVTNWSLTDRTNNLHYQLVVEESGICVTLEPQFSVVPQTITFGTTTYQEGVFVNAGIQIDAYVATITVEIDTTQGISLSGSLNDPIVLDPSWAFSVSSTDGTTGPSVSLSTYTYQDPESGQTITPHFALDGTLTLLGDTISADIDITESGFSITIDDTLWNVASTSLTGSFSAAAGLDLGGSFSAQIGTLDLGDLGTVNVNCAVAASLAIAVGSAVVVTVSGDVEVVGHSLTMSPVTLDVSKTMMENLADTLADSLVSALQDFYKDAENKGKAWFDDFSNGVITGVDDMYHVLEDVIGLSEDEVEALLDDAGTCAQKTVVSCM